MKTLAVGTLPQLYHEMSQLRIDDVLSMMRKRRERGRILEFVRGLRISAHLIYTLRSYLQGTGLEAHWGHIVDDNETVCSPECDVIIHRPDTMGLVRWNGNEKPVMDFHFVPQRSAVAVISCKSLIRSLREVDEAYCLEVKKYVDHVFLFAECCDSGTQDKWRKRVLDAGYAGFGYLYEYNRRAQSTDANHDVWRGFLSAVRERVTARSGKGNGGEA